ncbi:hypothetical protein GCK72_013009 [Caenorhabditis remanei]|uniref:Uncharacterized protein n=1 Tax=Caenorhabditis remanei TaxID=31234 RepID=A0A6A5GPU9_CAERE|nr:hypothetical protein GCK72_013009 [Caenorhabditis remanei]KAF1756556.1 hypothetical protein GCK72_013009 [Caenorhabditis remanei]
MKSGVAHPAVYTHPMIATFPHADLSRGYASSSTGQARKNEKSEHYTECEIPEKLLLQAEGKRIFEEEQDYIIPISKYRQEDVNNMSKLFCAQHLQKCMGVCRVIRDNLFHSAHLFN